MLWSSQNSSQLSLLTATAAEPLAEKALAILPIMLRAGEATGADFAPRMVSGSEAA